MSLQEYKEYKMLTDKISKTIKQGNVSHAYIIEGDSFVDKLGFAKDFVKAILCKEDPGNGCGHCVNCRKIDHDNYEDLTIVTSDDLSVKDAFISELQTQLKKKPVGGDRNIAIICDGDTMTTRAQNRLLKTLEEPNPGTVLIILSENTENLLPTIRSRCITYRLGNFIQNDDNEKLEFAGKILNMVLEGRYFCDLKDELSKGVRDRQEAFQLIDGLEKQFRKFLVDGGSKMRKEKIIENVGYAEEARRALLAKVNYKYVIRNLIIKIGG